MKTRLLILLLCVVPIYVPVYALECAPQTVGEKYNIHDAIIQGTVINKEYIVPTRTALVTFDVVDTFKGDTPDPLTIASNESHYGYVFHENFGYILFLDKDETEYHVPLCTPVYHALSSIVSAISATDESFMNTDSYLVEQQISEDEKQELEKIRAVETALRVIELENIDQGRAVFWTSIVIAIIAGIGLTIFFVVWKLRK